jgi:hypothetical protein
MFVRGFNPIWFFNNLTGSPVDPTYYAFFLTNTLPYIPQAVYQDPNGTNPWSDPIEFQASAGLPDNIYFNPALVYRIEIRQGPTQSDPLIYLIQNYTLSEESQGQSDIALTTNPNMITNPQFADIYFSSPFTITTSGTYNIAPGWDLITTGIGSTTVSQVPNAGNSDTQGNPPYYLTFSSNGWTSVQLQQRFNNNGAIFGGGAIAVAITGFATGSSAPISIIYAPSVGTSTTLLNQTIQIGSLTAYNNAVNIPASTNSGTGTSAFTNINIVLPATGTVSITNIQLTGQSLPLPGNYSQSFNPLFQEQSYERTVDQEFHVYKDSILTQPKKNLLVGWTFSLNPWQFSTTAITNILDNQYTADQTLIVQQNFVNSSVNNNVAVGQGTNNQNLAYVVQAVTANNQFAIIQYIDPRTISPYWNQILSSMVNASINTSHSTSVRFKMRLVWINSIPTTSNQTYPISSWTAGSDPVFSAGFTAIKPLNDPIYTLTSTNQNFSFDQFQLPTSLSLNMTLAVVIYTIDNMNQSSTSDQILFNRVSLVPNDFAIDASTETYDETLTKCQYYFEQSYSGFPNSRLNDYNGSVRQSVPLSVNSPTDFYASPFDIEFKTVKRSVPIMTFYSPTSGTIHKIRMKVENGSGSPAVDVDYDLSNYSTLGSSLTNYVATVNNTTPVQSGIGSTASNQGSMYFHYVADCRIGI